MNPSLHMILSIDICELLHSKFQTNGKWKKLYNWTIEKKILIGAIYSRVDQMKFEGDSF